jgi:hypothetical protein
MASNDDFAPHIRDLIFIAERLSDEVPFDHASPQARQSLMLRASYLDARKAYHENRGGDALKALGSFWSIYLGYGEQEPRYVEQARIMLSAISQIS